jgi:hypothetical protein
MNTVRQISKLLPVLGILCFSASPLSAQSGALSIVQQLPAPIVQVMTGGFWTRDKAEGFYRVIVVSAGVEHVSNQLFIQLMKINSDKQNYRIDKTLAVKELNKGHGSAMTVTTNFGDINAFEIDVAVNKRGGQSKRYKILVKGSGKYKIEARK